MGRIGAISTLVAIVIVSLSAIPEPASAGPLGGLLPGYQPWPAKSGITADSAWYHVSLVGSFINHVFLKPVILPHLPREPGLAVTIAPAARLDGHRLARVRDVLRRRLDNLGLVDSTIETTGQMLVVWVYGTPVGGTEFLETALGADIDLRLQLVEKEGAISDRVVSWLPDFVKERGEEALQIGLERGYSAELLKAPQRELLEAYVDWITPRISMIPTFAIGRQPSREGSAPEYLLYVLEEQPWLTGRDVAEASVGFNDWGEAYVSVEFTPAGGARFGEETGKHVDRNLAIIVDGEVVSAPVIREPITGGRAQITLGAGKPQELQEEARSLAARLSSGYLGVDLSVSSVEIVGTPAISRIPLIGWWLLPTVPGLPAFHSQLHFFVAAALE